MGIEIVAEIAQGFEGDATQSKLLVRSCAMAGADAAKFQLVFADELATPDYQFYSLFKSLEMPDETWSSIVGLGKSLNLEIQFDIFGLRSLRTASDLGVNTIKIHPTDISNVALIEAIERSDISRLLVGSGGAFRSEIERALDILGSKEIVLLLGFQGYPTETDTNQISRIRYFVERFSQRHPNLSIGFADHAAPDSGLASLLASMAIGTGATLIEKHITLNMALRLEDHESALNPDDFSVYSRLLREAFSAYGSSVNAIDFGMSQSELLYRKKIRRHVVSTTDIPGGALISPSDVTLKRTSDDSALTDLTEVYGRISARDIRINSPIGQPDLL